MQTLTVLSGGAAQGLFASIEAVFRERHGCAIDGTFGAVGMMRAKLADGHPADVVVLTAAILRDLAAAGDVIADTVTDIGRVETAIAVRGDDPAPDVADAAASSRRCSARTRSMSRIPCSRRRASMLLRCWSGSRSPTR